MNNLTTICYELERLSCSTHDKRPTLTVQNGTISISACCESFRQELSSKAYAKLKSSVDNKLDDLFIK